MSTHTEPYAANVATFKDFEKYGYARNAVNCYGKKELMKSEKLTAFEKKTNTFHTVLDARWYMGRSSSASVLYCSVWITLRNGRSISGHGSAGGGGYDKYSAAFDDAVTSAGIILESSVHGYGEGPMHIAMTAIAKAAGYGRLQQTIS